ncbi:hypothetical protein Tco_0736871 [Tanacetum coccineum]
MDNLDITMEEYIELEAEKARRHGQTFNWETATYGKVRHHEDIDYFKDFEIDFLSFIFIDPLATDHKISSKPMTKNDDNKVNIYSDDVVVEQSNSGIDANVKTQYHEFAEDFETNHDTPVVVYFKWGKEN